MAYGYYKQSNNPGWGTSQVGRSQILRPPLTLVVSIWASTGPKLSTSTLM